MFDCHIPDYAFQRGAVCRLHGVKRFVIGKSLCGRSIFAVRIGCTGPLSLIAGGFHGMEYLTVLSVLRFAAECAEKPELLGGKSVMLVPCVNPDGTEIALHGAKAACRFQRLVQKTGESSRWQANARGVDINHNFNAGWQEVKRREIAAGITKPSPTRFGGCFPESEPETRALTALCRQYHFARVLALHSQGREIYWDFGKYTPQNCLDLAQRLSDVSGYRVASPEPMAVGGGFKDWFIRCFHRCGITVEMGLGKNPLPLSDFEEEYPLVKNILREYIRY